MRRARYQNGWMERKERKDGEVWVFRFRDYGTDSEPTTRSVPVGALAKYPTESDAWRALELMRLDINGATPTGGQLMSVSDLVRHYRKYELSDMEGDDRQEGEKAAGTKDGYASYLDLYIVPKWGTYKINEVRATAVEDWLKVLRRVKKKNGVPLPMARGTKKKIRDIMHAVWKHALRHEFTDRNPISYVRQSGKRERVPEIMTVEEFIAFFAQLKQRERVMVLLDAGTGLRRGELFGLKWGDIDTEQNQANVIRSILLNTKGKRVGFCKTEASRAPVPLDEFMLEELALWRLEAEYSEDGDWVFASAAVEGDYPYWPDTILTRHIRPAAQRAGITKHIGWHTFRHCYASLLKANGEDIKTVQELLRHADSRTTMDIYTHAISETKRQAQSKVVRMILPRKAANE